MSETAIRQLSPEAARVIGDALVAMARADGVIDPRELEVVERFLSDCAATVARRATAEVTAEALRQATDGLTEGFLSACTLLAFADGDFTAEEAVLLRRYAGWCGVDEARLREIVEAAQREQPAPSVTEAPPMATLVEVLGGWSHEHLPALREKVERLLAAQA